MTLKVVARCGDPMLLKNAIKFFHGVKDLNTRDSALEGLELFGSTKWKLELTPSDIAIHIDPTK